MFCDTTSARCRTIAPQVANQIQGDGMDDETVLREATQRRDAALAEARRLDDFIRLFNDLRGGAGRGAPLSVVGETKADGDFVLEKQRR
jgi:hypothetical protein